MQSGGVRFTLWKPGRGYGFGTFWTRDENPTNGPGGEAPFASGSRHGMSPISCDKGLIANLNDEKRGLFSVTWSQWFLPGMVRKPLRIDS